MSVCVPLGEVKPSSTTTALRATANAQAIYGQLATVAFQCQALQFQALSTNTGAVYICDRETPTLTIHVLGEIPPPGATPVTRPVWAVGDPGNPAHHNVFNAATFWILPAVSGEGVRITAIAEAPPNRI